MLTEAENNRIVVILSDEGGLIAELPGPFSYKLIPVCGTLFDLQDYLGFSIEFKKNEQNKVVEAILCAPNGIIRSYIAKKVFMEKYNEFTAG